MCPDTNVPIDFLECKSAGWITAAVSDDKRAWVFPFGRTIATIPDAPIGQVEELRDVTTLDVGSRHIVVVTGSYDRPCIWTFGLNDHGQRGFLDDAETSETGWRKLDIGENVRFLGLRCGKWSTYLVVERKITNTI